MKIPRMVQGPSTARSLLTMASDFQTFRMAGSDIRKAKEFHNVIDEPLFKIPIEQVSQTLTRFRDCVWHIYSNSFIFNCIYMYTIQVAIPSLHVSLGVFKCFSHYT